MTKKNKSSGGRLFLFLFAMPFALVGIGMLVFAVIPNLYDWARMQSWTTVDAQLLSSNLESHRGDKSTTYKVVASYRYQYDGQTYIGHRVGISEKSDNIGDWHQQTYSRLRAASPLQIWVNPGDPQEAIFDRDLRWGKLGFYMIFVLVFGGVGIGLAWWASRKPVEIPEGVPIWQGNPKWRNNQILSSAKTGVWFFWIFAAFWNLISSPVLFAIPGELAKGNKPILIALLFPLAGLILIGVAIKNTREWRRFGAAPLQLDPYPGSIGGDVGGSVQLNQALPRDATARVQISCVYVYSSGSGKDSRTTRDVKWQDQQQVPVEAGIRGSTIKFRFTTPEGLPDSEVKSMPYYEWTLDVTCQLPGADFDRTYTIPVANTGSPQQSRIHPMLVTNAENIPLVSPRVMRVSRDAQGLHLHFPVLRNLTGGLAGVLVGGLFVVMAWVFASGVMKHPPPIIFPIVFGSLGSLAFVGGLYSLVNSLTVITNSRGLVVTRRIFGLAFSKPIPVGNIKSFEVAKGMQSSQGNRTTVYYKIKLHTQDGKKVTVAESITGVSAAEQVAKILRDACQIS